MSRGKGCPKGTIHLTATRVKVAKLYHKHRKFRIVAKELGITIQSASKTYKEVVNNREEFRKLASDFLKLKFKDDNVT